MKHSDVRVFRVRPDGTLVSPTDGRSLALLSLDKLLRLPAQQSWANLWATCVRRGTVRARARLMFRGKPAGPCTLLGVRDGEQPGALLVGLVPGLGRSVDAAWAAFLQELEHARAAESRQSAAALRTLEQRLTVAMRSLKAGIWDWHLPDGNVVYIPWESSTESPDYRETHASTWDTQVHPDDTHLGKEQVAAVMAGRSDAFRTVVRQRIVPLGSWRVVESHGRVIERAADGTPLRLMGTYVDITDRVDVERQLKEREAALQRAAHFAVLGEMASGMAHELNQPLAALIAYLSVAEKRVPSARRSALRDALASASKMADRMAATITYVRRIARRAPPQTEPLDLNTLTRDAVEDAQQTLPDRRIILRFEPARDPASARALGDPLQIRQVITNLVRNGIDACQQSKGRQVVVRVFVEPDALAVAVTDAGPGVSARNLPHLFEPFFTTKPDGTGLGLSLSRSIAEAHGGSLRLEDAKRGRCTFVLRLPRTSALEER